MKENIGGQCKRERGRKNEGKIRLEVRSSEAMRRRMRVGD